MGSVQQCLLSLLSVCLSICLPTTAAVAAAASISISKQPHQQRRRTRQNSNSFILSQNPYFSLFTNLPGTHLSHTQQSSMSISRSLDTLIYLSTRNTIYIFICNLVNDSRDNQLTTTTGRRLTGKLAGD